MQFKTLVGFVIALIFPLLLTAQPITQTIKGTIVDKMTLLPLPGATVVILSTDPLIGSATDIDGKFVIRNVAVGRYAFKASFMGYESITLNEILVGSGKEVVLNIALQEVSTKMNEVVIKAAKGGTNNAMATINARQFSVEEAARYAGGFDDPARLASSFAGVSGSLGNNGIVIRGNAPKGLLWRMEGVDISDPSHFANLQAIGAGALTALSSQMLANSDFYTGAFPADYGNALSGVFDIKLRTGNNEKQENTFQLGIVGIDLASEGPFKKGKKSSYIFNYRYSTLSLLAPILPKEMGALNYQDLSFKLNFPTKKMGTFAVWGLGAWDSQAREALPDQADWESDVDKEEYKTKLYMGALGVNHILITGSRTYINTTLASTASGLFLDQKTFNDSMLLLPTEKIENTRQRYSLTSVINHKFHKRHNNKSGITLSRLNYNILIQQADSTGQNMVTYALEKGKSYLYQAFTQSRFEISPDMSAVAGLHLQYLGLNNHYSVEPRVSFGWDFRPRHTLCLSYGLHSQLEQLNFYMVRQYTPQGIIEPNRDLNFSKAHHLVLSYEYKMSENKMLKVEPYYQALFDIPVVPGSYYSLQNLEEGIFFNDSLVNEGSGKNFGLDITLERYLNKGYYYLGTVSCFVSNYKGGDGIERNSRYNRNYVLNLLAGKEWILGASKNKILNINGKVTLMGGEWLTPLDVEATYAAKEIVEDVTHAFTERKPAAQILSVSFSYRINKPRYAGTWSFSYMNVLGYTEFNGYRFDKLTNTIQKEEDTLVIPNLSYKIEF